MYTFQTRLHTSANPFTSASLIQRMSLTMAMLAVCTGAATGATIHVPGDQPTLQAGIDAAAEGDTVLVAPGTYTGEGNRDLDFGGIDRVLVSEAGAEATVIDCEGEVRAFSFRNEETSASVLQGFTITGGVSEGTETDRYGGAVFCENGASPRITQCAFTDNSSALHGGAIYCGGEGSGYTSTISECTFTGNSGNLGGAVFLSNSPSATITRCTFTGNSGGKGGGGIYCKTKTERLLPGPTITSCTITGNDASQVDEDTKGGGIYCSTNAPAVITNCMIMGNEADTGGGIYSYGDPTITNCTIANNSAQSGGGIRGEDRSDLTITNSILWGNTPNALVTMGGATVVNYSNVEGEWDGIGNINANPLFVDTSDGDYHLSDGSPCIDAGTVDGAPDTDFDGDARFQGDGIDMGADEYVSGENCDLEVTLSGQPASVKRGGALSFRADVSNDCDDPLTFDRAVLNVTGPASLEMGLYDGAPFTVVESVGKPLSLSVPAVAPMGSYTVGVTIYQDGTVIDADAFDVNVIGG